MFEKLFLLVKNNAGKAVVENPVIAAKDRDAVIIEASSSIIEVMKNQMESGKLNDLIKFFKYSGIYGTALISSMVNRFANKLNKFYGIEPNAAHDVAEMLIPGVMADLTQQVNGKDGELALSTMLSNLNGNRADLAPLVHRLMVA